MTATGCCPVRGFGVEGFDVFCMPSTLLAATRPRIGLETRIAHRPWT